MRFYEYGPTHAEYALCLNEKSFVRAMDKMKVPPEDRLQFVSDGKNATAHFFETDKGLRCLVCVGDVSQYSHVEVMGLICHECVHVWQEIKSWMGERAPGEEIEAYSIQSIFVNLMSEWNRKSRARLG